jgi:hypothetical protein|tara:strand:- start:15 stop:404 length:390 start_codon:yes stop_codon:yes gene_type:complete
MGNYKSKTKCYILDDFNKKHTLEISDFKVHNQECFIFFKTKKPFNSKEIQLFIYKEPNKKNEIRKYIIQSGFNLDEKNLTYTKNGKQEYLEFIEFIPNDSMKISIRLDMNFKIKLVVFRFKSKDLHIIN